jgi:magnesium-dependent phosphatase-1
MIHADINPIGTKNYPSTIISLIVFDCDDTLWFGMDGAYISGVDFWDEGRQDFTFQKIDRLTIRRNDGLRFQLFPEVLDLLEALERRNVLLSIASYNHRPPVMDALRAFGIEQFFFHPVIEWHSQKDKMLKTILNACRKEGYLVSPETTLFIDDDMKGIYRTQMNSCGIHFIQRGVDIQDLAKLLEHPGFNLVPVQRSLI